MDKPEGKPENVPWLTHSYGTRILLVLILVIMPILLLFLYNVTTSCLGSCARVTSFGQLFVTLTATMVAIISVIFLISEDNFLQYGWRAYLLLAVLLIFILPISAILMSQGVSIIYYPGTPVVDYKVTNVENDPILVVEIEIMINIDALLQSAELFRSDQCLEQVDVRIQMEANTMFSIDLNYTSSYPPAEYYQELEFSIDGAEMIEIRYLEILK